MTIQIVEAWRKNDPKLEAEAIAFWDRHQINPAGTTPQARAKELAAVAYDNGEVVALSTINVELFVQLRQKFAFIREAVAPSYRRNKVGGDLLIATRDIAERYSREHPEEKIAGAAAVYQVPGVGTYGSGRTSKLALVGYTDRNEQVRVMWFDHVQVPPNAPKY